MFASSPEAVEFVTQNQRLACWLGWEKIVSWSKSRISKKGETYNSQKSIYVLIWLAEEPAVNFLEPAVNLKNKAYG